MSYKEYTKLDFPSFEKEILTFWKQEKIFEQTVTNRDQAASWVFYEGPPSANGKPGIHHVMARTIKDIFCRYRTLKGYKVERKGGWDTHGLPIELQVEKTLGITKEDIGSKISVSDYNKACKTDVLKFKDDWDLLTEIMGYWVDLDNPYITYENDYIETVWYLLKQFFDKGLLYKGYTIQPYSPAAGTGLSSHELNQPGTYKNIKDTTVVAQFKADSAINKKFGLPDVLPVYYLAWTTTPWTLPSNTALAVGAHIDYAFVHTFNPYTAVELVVVLAHDLLSKYFDLTKPDQEMVYASGQKNLPYRLLTIAKGKELEALRYEQLLPYAQPEQGDAFKVLCGDFVTTEDGTGIVHIAPSFGSDDFKVARQNGIGALTLVDKRGRFVPGVLDFANEFVKEQYLNDAEKETEREKQGRDKYLTVDERISIKLKTENKAFKVEKYEHSYPHCWRTDKPILYYPLESWFIKTTAAKDRLIALNETINWKPKSTGVGRFGNWLENLVDWNLSRSRYWGTPLPIWRNEAGTETKCIGSVAELDFEIKKALTHGIEQGEHILPNAEGNYSIELHKPYVDEVVLSDSEGKPMHREPDLIDVWFDSGAMPYAQWHYPFSKQNLEAVFPADFIAEGVDQTRGWFFTLHAISVMLFDSVAFKNVLANGLVLDKNGNKMSKRLGNAVDPFTTIEKFGADAVRWYMLSNASPWDNLKFDLEGVAETQRKFFATLYNVYSFFALYANIDAFDYSQPEVANQARQEIDRWILSLLQTLINEVDDAMLNYDATAATRAIQHFVSEDLSNWYVRLCRRRFWKGEFNSDKLAAYQTLYTCLETVAKLMSSFAPFYADRLYRDLIAVTGRENHISVHLSDFPVANEALIDKELELSMDLAQKVSSLVLSVRKKQNIRVRQPLQRVMIPVANESFKQRLDKVTDLILAEVNVKTLEYLTPDKLAIKKSIKANFRVLGKKVGKLMKQVAEAIESLPDDKVTYFEQHKTLTLEIEGHMIELVEDDLDISFDDIPGWQVATDGAVLIALDISISESLQKEGLARELVNRVQQLRKETELEVTDKINISIACGDVFVAAFNDFKTYICNEVLAQNLEIVGQDVAGGYQQIEIDNEPLSIKISKAL